MALIKKENYHELSTKRESYSACAFKSKPWNSPLFTFPFLWISTANHSEVTNRTKRNGWFFIGTAHIFFTIAIFIYFYKRYHILQNLHILFVKICSNISVLFEDFYRGQYCTPRVDFTLLCVLKAWFCTLDGDSALESRLHNRN